MTTYPSVENLLKELDVPEKGLLNRTIYHDAESKIMLFSFSQGHEMPTHKTPMTAVIQILHGEATVTLGDETREASAGFLVCLPPQVPHAIVAKTPTTMLLT